MTDPQDMIIYNAMGGLAGLFIGLWIEQKYIRFRIDVTTKQKVLRFLVGGVLYYLINKYVPNACRKYMGIWPGSFIYNFIQLIFPTAIYPFLFSHISFLGSGQEAPRLREE